MLANPKWCKGILATIDGTSFIICADFCTWIELSFNVKDMETSEKGAFKRYHFYKGLDKRLIYVVLSDEERKEIIKAFKEKMGDSYAYQDTILSGMTGGVIQHRFYRPKAFNTSITFIL